jgi:hypothetical protein
MSHFSDMPGRLLMSVVRGRLSGNQNDANDPRTSSLGEKFCKFQFSSVAGRSYGRPIAAPFLTNMLKHLSANRDNTLIPNSQIARGPEREVEDAVTNVWSAVCNANNH